MDSSETSDGVVLFHWKERRIRGTLIGLGPFGLSIEAPERVPSHEVTQVDFAWGGRQHRVDAQIVAEYDLGPGRWRWDLQFVVADERVLDAIAQASVRRDEAPRTGRGHWGADGPGSGNAHRPTIEHERLGEWDRSPTESGRPRLDTAEIQRRSDEWRPTEASLQALRTAATQPETRDATVPDVRPARSSTQRTRVQTDAYDAVGTERFSRARSGSGRPLLTNRLRRRDTDAYRTVLRPRPRKP